jgi:antitoxin component YwqK of YwqJK toxin-antitoxin module
LKVIVKSFWLYRKAGYEGRLFGPEKYSLSILLNHKLPQYFDAPNTLVFFPFGSYVCSMKMFLLAIVLLLAETTPAQFSQKYYDYRWKPCSASEARFVSLVAKTDSGWLREDYFLANNQLQMKGLFEDSALRIANGFFYYYYANGMTEMYGRNVHNKKEGLWLHFYHDGIMQDSTVYENGLPAGTSIGWHLNGYQSDSIVYSASGSVEVNWFDNGLPASAGHKKLGKAHGTWQFFSKSGKLSAVEVFDTGRLVARKYYRDDGTGETDTTSKNREATFPGGADGWKRFILKHIYFPDQYKLVNATAVTVVVAATIDEDGNVTDPWVEVPFNKDFDKIAVEIFKKSPRWNPAIRYNRPVQQGVRQPITFAQEE